ncbi:MAG: TauD/TfdA family dioxygenase [Planctomycetaceae bacterium]|nr:TauD/TfdA family dioxygenase [Planctomycetaceae bacterium]
MTAIQVTEAAVPGQRHEQNSVFPLVLVCQTPDATLEDVTDWIAENREQLIARSAEVGTILFRGFPVANDQDFDRFLTAFGLPNFRYEDSLSNAVRVVRTERVFTANEAPPEVNIYLHHEMAQTPVYPSRLFFFCEKAADQGGETPLCRSDVLYEMMKQQLPQFAADCAAKGLKYSHTMPAANDAGSGMGRSWQSTLRADTPDQAEARLQGLGYTWEWLEDGCLKVTTPVLPAVRDLSDGRQVFFNQLIAAFNGWKDSRNDPSRSITFGDGTPLDPATMKQVIDLAETITFDTPWQTGDVALVDNYVAMHGRRTFTGTRKVLASLVAAE